MAIKTPVRSTKDHRICFFGDSFVHGTCDPECLGWAGRVSSKARQAGFDITSYNLGIRRDTSRDILKRWDTECFLRFQVESERYVVFSFGANDMTMENGSLRVPFSESIENFTRIVSTSKTLYNTLVVGPPPVGDPDQDSRIIQVCNAYSRSSADIGVPYLPVSETLLSNPLWISEIKRQDGTHPGASGYSVLAGLVTSWDKWWFNPLSS